MTHISTSRVYYADTDNGGAVYYANYLRWFEIGRVELLRESGVTQDMLEKEGMILPVVEVKCQYKHPATHDDTVRIETDIQRIGNSSITFSYRILRDNDDRLLAEGHTVNVLAKEGASCPLPGWLREKIDI